MTTRPEPSLAEGYYRIGGLTVASALALPGSLEADGTAPDVQIRREAGLPAMLADASAQGPNWSVAGDRILMDIPGVARFLVTGGREIAVEGAAAVAEADIAGFVQSSAMRVLLHQRRQMTLRASAIAVENVAALLCGPPGVGKSTLAAALVARGHDFFSDDLCAVRTDARGVPILAPDGATLRLWAPAIDALGLADRRSAPLRAGFQKFHVEPDRIARASELPILAIYMVREADAAGPPGIVALPIGDAAMLLRRNAHGFHLAARTGGSASLFEQAATLQQRVPMFGLARSTSFATLAETAGRLDAHMRALGRARAAA
ncbi:MULTISPECIES: hypothetical protein [unclassified Sphingomonas]|uniref:hypothetical protein n=1 Tax=unclassified Sphingomonas TaxID=196159 RepID=UPI00070238E0|nr:MULTISPECIES: hypothetical protein [unclassified Sphingomonas]KQX19465.1 hypothetical protein ASD17_13130 [Sphingomonas sp. Root1294]KQY65666.1 hypothetical protein ASD39_16330 [Sphingomonas sp. Root50]KRB95030.1 hypothetical protein ASE22_03725 [Sphingomonas sp. Root720]